MNIGKSVNDSVKNSIHADIHRFMRESIFETMLDVIKGRAANLGIELIVPVRDSVPNPINIII